MTPADNNGQTVSSHTRSWQQKITSEILYTKLLLTFQE